MRLKKIIQLFLILLLNTNIACKNINFKSYCLRSNIEDKSHSKCNFLNVNTQNVKKRFIEPCIILGFVLSMIYLYDILFYNTNLHFLDNFNLDNKLQIIPKPQLCDLNFSNVLLGAHHKTGTMLLTRHFQKAIQDFQKEKCNISNLEIPKEYCLNKESILSFINNKNGAKIINIVRNPVDTVLSGYNYHLKSREKWLFNDINEQKKYYQKVLLRQKKKNNIRYNAIKLHCQYNIIQKLSKNLSVSENNIHSLYNNLTLDKGLYFEYSRFINCEFNLDILESYQTIKYLKNKFKKYYHYKFINMRLESFSNDYNDSVIKFLDFIDIYDKNQRDLFKILINYNIKTNFKKRSHITQNTYNRENQIKILLNDSSICKNFKNMSLLLNYDWEYINYC